MCEFFRICVIKEQHVELASLDRVPNLFEYFFVHDRIIIYQASRDRLRERELKLSSR